jgi:hypothetical protein
MDREHHGGVPWGHPAVGGIRRRAESPRCGPGTGEG